MEQESLQLKAHFVSERLINNSSAAQWDHKSVDGTLRDVSVAVYEPLLPAEECLGSLMGLHITIEAEW